MNVRRDLNAPRATDHRRSATALFAVAFFFWFSQYAYSSYINPVLMEAGMSAIFMGAVGAVYGAVQLLFRIPVGLIADRRNCQKTVVALGCGLSLISAAGLVATRSPMLLMFFRATGGMAACSWVSCTVLYSRFFPRDESAGHITQLNTGSYFGRLAAYGAVAALIPLGGMRISFWVGAAGAAAALLLCLPVENRGTDRPSAGWRDFLPALRDRNLLACAFLGALVQLIAFATEYSFATNVQVEMGASAEQISYFSIALLIPSILANYLVGRMILAGRSPRMILMTGFALMGLYSFLTPRAAALWQFYPIQVLAGVGNSCTIAVLLGQCVRTVPEERRSTAMGVFQAVYSLGLTFGPLLMGAVIDLAGYSAGFTAMAALSLAGIGLTWRLISGGRKAA